MSERSTTHTTIAPDARRDHSAEEEEVVAEPPAPVVEEGATADEDAADGDE